VTCSGSGGFGGGAIYTIDAPFLDGGLFARTGIYFNGSKSAWIAGARAAMFVALGLGLRVPPALREELGLRSCTFEDLHGVLVASRTR